MKNQLIPNTYTICESEEQCKELFEWAKANGIPCESNGWLDEDGGDTMLLFDSELWCFETGYTPVREKFIPLPEFIARLKGEYEKGVSVTFHEDYWKIILDCVLHKGHDDIADMIEEQLNKQP